MLDLALMGNIAGLLGVTAQQLIGLVQNLLSRSSAAAVEKRMADEKQYATPENKVAVMSGYYSPSSEDESIRSLSLQTSRIRRALDFYIRTDTVRPGVDLRSWTMSEEHSPPPEPTHERASVLRKRLSADALARIISHDHKCWNGATFRLTKLTPTPAPCCEFARSDFFAWRFNTGLMVDELTDALVEAKGDASMILADRARWLPLREIVMPHFNSLHRYHTRSVLGGCAVVFAMARKRERDFVLLYHERSEKVIDARGILSAIPQGFHQPLTDRGIEVHLVWTVFRELYEEVFGGTDAEKPSGHVAHDWYVSKTPGLQWFFDHEGAFLLEDLGFGVVASNGLCAFEVLLAVPDTWYWETFSRELKPIWESNQILEASTRDAEGMQSLLERPLWGPEVRVAFVRALQRLRQMYPERVDVPDVQLVGIGSV